MKKQSTLSLLVLSILLAAGCQAEKSTTDAEAVDPGAVAADSTAAMPEDAAPVSQGKPGAPVEITYEVIGSPIVGVPVSINVVVTSAQGPLKVRYSINDASALMFQDGQLESLEIVDPSTGSLQQLTVVPQREGRLYVNVSAEVPADMGTMIRSIAIPLKVGRAPAQSTTNGELREGPDGDKVIAMPAEESN